MRRVVSVCLGALALTGFHALTDASAQEATTTTTPATTSTTAAPVPPATSTTTTTVKKNSTTSTTAASTGGRPVPPPAAGPTQTLVPDLLGTPVDVSTSSTVAPFTTFRNTTPTSVPTSTQSAATISVENNSPSGPTLILAAIAWLASFGGLLVYAEDRRATKWKHLAR